MDKFFTEMFQIGEAMYLLGSHCSFIKTLVSNPEWMAEKCVGTTGDVCKFKAEPHNQGSEDLFGRIMFLERKSYTSQVPKSAKRNLAQSLDSDDDDNENPAGKFSNVWAETSATRQEGTTATQKRRKQKQK